MIVYILSYTRSILKNGVIFLNNKSRVGKPSRVDILKSQINIIIDEIVKYKNNVLSINDIGNILNLLLEENDNFRMPYNLSRKNFTEFLCNEEILKLYEIERKDKKSKKYVFGDFNKYELALTLNGKSYLSHYTAVFLHGLTENIPKVIYTNTEQFLKSPKSNKNMEQLNIDRAFSRPMRLTNNRAYLDDLEVIMLNGKNTGWLEVIEMNILNKVLPVTSIERTLIDIVVRPLYSGGVAEVLNIYINAKDNFSTGRLLSTLSKFDYAYPYHQSIGFYMEKAGYPESTLKRLDNIDKLNDFYLTYQMKEVSYSKRWRLYYPSYLD